AQERLRIARRRRLHQPVEIREQGGIFGQGALPPAAWAPHAPGFCARPRLQLLQAAPDGRIRDPRRAGHGADPSPSRRPRLAGGPDPAAPLRQGWTQRLVLRSPEPEVHPSRVSAKPSYSFSYYLTLPNLIWRCPMKALVSAGRIALLIALGIGVSRPSDAQQPIRIGATMSVTGAYDTQ